jgi:hypothetical protein
MAGHEIYGHDVFLRVGDLPEEVVRDLDCENLDSDDVVDVPVEVHFKAGWYRDAKLSGHPDSWEPADGEDPEILHAFYIRADNSVAEDLLDLLSKAQLRKLTSRAWDVQDEITRDYCPE